MDNPLEAARILQEEKKPEECSYPGCHEPRAQGGSVGRPTVFCTHPDHNPVNKLREFARLRKIAGAPPKKHFPSDTRGPVIDHILSLQEYLERYLSDLAEISDPALAEAHRQAENTKFLHEQALRHQAEAALQIAQQERISMEETLIQVQAQMEERESTAQLRIAEIEAQIQALHTEHATALQEAQNSFEHRLQAIEQQHAESLALKQQEAIRAQEEVRLANANALEARTQAAAANRLIQELQHSLERERTENVRIHTDLEEVRSQAQTALQEERHRAQADLDRERGEVNRLREELATVQQQAALAAQQANDRADRLISGADDLRAQLIQIQLKRE